MAIKIKICIRCNKEIKKFGSSFRKLCYYCNNARLTNNKPRSNSSIKKKVRKATGELELFQRLHIERGDNCEWCGDFINGFSVWNFHHVKFKSTYPELRLDPTNIVKICQECHIKAHN